ncbi:DUF732 domain-containing protein [Mycolicibacterium rufum]|uniref:DUF732 domain-containing protein n=1 Tax=Mycolicibacterium rufum TaxID=318424 RepID=A0A9X2YI70_9MYCO|nr:DUF732 domain-containing protein [Mycolicibacterium rufum]MCV7074223.1 DUF732 domain-containing protein [Mycolicibacterium rufum]ULP36580.1 DUF732 domain-containing protein [Mycolicibacterium rufum]
MQHGSRSARAGVAGLSLLVASSAWLTGCSAGDDVISGMSSEIEPAPTHGQDAAQPPGPPQPGGQSNALMVTPRQRAYLDALRSEGVHPTSDLSALSIGSYVCQARAAKQPDQAVWDFVAPLVRNDASDPRSDGGAGKPSATELRDETADYIRIATDRLC